MTTNDQDKGIEAIMSREGYDSVKVSTLKTPALGNTSVALCVTNDPEADTRAFLIAEDGAHVAIRPSGFKVLGYPAYEEAKG